MMPQVYYLMQITSNVSPAIIIGMEQNALENRMYQSAPAVRCVPIWTDIAAVFVTPYRKQMN